jgi:hypothetical protein
MQWAEQQRFVQPSTRNRVKFVSLPDEEQKRIYDRWRSMSQGEDAERTREANRWLTPNQDPKRYDHIKFDVRLDSETAQEDQKRLMDMLGTEDPDEMRDKMMDLAGLGGIAKMVKSVDVLTWEDPKDFGGKGFIKVMGRGDNGLHFDRNLTYLQNEDPDKPWTPWTVENVLFSVDRKAPAGVGTRMLASQVGATQQAGFESLETEATRAADMNGHYTWPRLGFNAALTWDDYGELEKHDEDAAWQVRKLALADADRMFKDAPFELFHLMAIPEARKWWEGNGRSIETSFPLDEDIDGGKAYQLLRAYTEAKAMTEGKTIPEYLAKMAAKKKGKNMPPRLTKQDQEILDRVWEQTRKKLQANVKTKKKASELAAFWLRTQVMKSSMGI